MAAKIGPRAKRWTVAFADWIAKKLAGSNDLHWALADQAITSGATFFTSLLVARFLGVAMFGRFTLCWLVIYLVQNIQIAIVLKPLETFGVTRPPSTRPAYLGAVIVNQGAICLATLLLVLAGANLTSRLAPSWGIGELAAPLALAAAAVQLPDLLRTIFYSQRLSVWSCVSSASRYSLQIAGVFGAVYFLPPEKALPAVLLVLALSALITSSIYFRQIGTVEFVGPTIRCTTHRHWILARWMLASIALALVMETVTNIAVGAFLGLREVGLLRATNQIIFLVNVPLQGLSRVVSPMASLAYSTGGAAGLKAFIVSSVLPVLAGIALTVVLIACGGRHLMTAIYGPEFAGSAFLLRMLALAMLVVVAREAFLIMVRAIRRPEMDFYANLVAATVSAIILVPLLKLAGLLGAALTSLSFAAISLAVMSALLVRSRAWRHEG